MRKIIIEDSLKPEPSAMVQALYSRDPGSAEIHIDQVKERGADKFMGSYYVGYGHKSIGDCGSTALFIENVSMLAAKAVQDWPLYSGQEVSTRYINMATQEVLNPLGTPEGQAIQDEWMRFYRYALEKLVPILKQRYPIREGDKDTVYEKAIKARAFDIMRGFIPAGLTTSVAWHTNLRQAADHLKWMRHHPLPEIRDVALETLAALKAKYPPSFSHKEYETEEAYIEQSMSELTYFDDAEAVKGFSYTSMLDLVGLKAHKKLLATRPPKAELHEKFRQHGNIRFTFPLDFGSYRDLQRHRSMVQEMPLLTTSHGFHPWYLEQLDPSLRAEAEAVLAEQEQRVNALDASAEVKQYYTAMGFIVSVKITGPLPAAIYTAELRSGDAVHPTLRIQAQRMGDAIKEAVPGIAMHHDTSPGIWNIKRGNHDIVRKE